ncbi:dihydrolipoyl dehydrogenase [Ammoniphilus oxalaticus]|uniref:Dihydrolipoyl dehydrogenase n=1 Tax=Ammoniphilus oxalaticus TaxID=66863 RepID=A0A419SN16_9BACL|nr:dihydrolipoyl dehydrogenase [Ammoniphilus oxalaticus]RKD25601.1 dihydrolipoyl dehydrogenase [Ammoniphilus oxalaticus]
MSSNEYDVVVLGGGTGGYVAAIRASQLGLKVAVVEKDRLGGTCLHRGCIPSKALLRSAEVYHTINNGEEFGVEATGIQFNFSKAQQRKQKIVEQLHQGVQYLMDKGKIAVFYGEGRIMGPSIFSPQAGAVAVTTETGESEILAPKYLLIATGSRPRLLSGLEIDGEYVLTSDEALQLDQLPNSILIIGGGAIGIEWASLLSDLGVAVELIETAERILPLEDEAISDEMTRLLTARGIKIHTVAKAEANTLTKENGRVSIVVEKNGQQHRLEADKLLVSIGRQANIENIGLDNTEVKIENGVIRVNDQYQTDEQHIYAIGDVIGGLQLAHVAAHEGIYAIEHLAGVADRLLIDPLRAPKVTYSRPQVASIGLTEQQARQQGFEIKIGTFPFRAIGKALIDGQADGFVKLIANARTDDVLGAHMIGPSVSELISEAALARLLDATPWELGKTIHPHPALSEIIGEAALAVDGKAIHT